MGQTKPKERWRMRYNNEIQKLIEGEDSVKFTKAQTIKWWRYLNRMEDIKLVKKITDWKPLAVRTKRQPKNRWRDKVMMDLKKLKLRNWESDS